MTQNVLNTYLAARQQHQAGQLAPAKELYEQVLSIEPSHADALHWLGILASQVNRHDIAIELLTRAVQVCPLSAEFQSNLGTILCSAGRIEESLACCRRATELDPNLADAHSNLGNALWAKNLHEDAAKSYAHAIKLNPGFAQAHYNLANCHRVQKRFAEAIEHYEKAISLAPNYAEAYCNLGTVLRDAGRLQDAMEKFESAFKLQPNYLEAINNMGAALKELRRFEDAVPYFERAIALQPSFSEAHHNLAGILKLSGRADDAIASYQRAIRAKPDNVEAYNDLGNLLSECGFFDDALNCYREVIAKCPTAAGSYSNLGNTLKDMGLPDQAVAALRQGLALNPAAFAPHDTLLLTMTYQPGQSSADIIAEARNWGRLHADALFDKNRKHPNNLSPNRKLKIGYVSGDFHQHPVGRFIYPLLANHDRERFEIYCYSQSACVDEVTRKLQQHADVWRQTEDLRDEQLDAMIRDDQIDILIDLSLHSRANRLLVFARKPAPVQITFAGYPGTTGMSAIDYRLSDRFLDPETTTDDYPEKTARLSSFWCYDATLNPATLSSPPFEACGKMTFGSLNSFCKINDEVLDLWAKVVAAVAGSQFMLLSPEGSCKTRVIQAFERHDVAAGRIIFADRAPHLAYLQLYNRIDICLDTFPYNGHTTSLDALWMGVPVVTLAGKTIVGRGGVSQLTNLGLTELIAHEKPDFIDIATRLANDPDQLKELRQSLRPRMIGSPLMDAKLFAREVEAAYQTMWQTWVAGQLQP